MKRLRKESGKLTEQESHILAEKGEKLKGITGKGYCRYKKLLPKFLGGDGNALIVYVDILDRYNYLIRTRPKQLIRKDFWFIHRADYIEAKLGMNRAARGSAIKRLVEMGMIKTHNKNAFQRQSVWVNEAKFEELLEFEKKVYAGGLLKKHGKKGKNQLSENLITKDRGSDQLSENLISKNQETEELIKGKNKESLKGKNILPDLRSRESECKSISFLENIDLDLTEDEPVTREHPSNGYSHEEEDVPVPARNGNGKHPHSRNGNGHHSGLNGFGTNGHREQAKPVPTEEEELSRELYEGLRSQGKLLARQKPPKWKEWAKPLIRLLKGMVSTMSRKEAVADIRSAMKFVIEHISETYCPKAYCTESFVEKFDNIKAAMKAKKDKEQEKVEKKKKEWKPF